MSPLIESTEALFADRYQSPGVTYSDEVLAGIRETIGGDRPVNVVINGSESIRIAGRDITIHHTPGHTEGHIVLYDEKHGVLIGGDAERWIYRPPGWVRG